MKICVLSLIAIFLASCAPQVTQVAFTLGNPGIACNAAEVRPSSLSTVAVVVCADKDGKPIGIVGGVGKPQMEVVLQVAEIATTMGAVIVGGRYLVKAAGSIEKPWASRVEFPDND